MWRKLSQPQTLRSAGCELTFPKRHPWGRAGVRDRGYADWCGCGPRNLGGHSERVSVDNCIRLVNADS